MSILGEKLATSRLDGDALYTAPGRPVAVISQVVVEYKAAPTPPPPPRKPPAMTIGARLIQAAECKMQNAKCRM